ncbi:FtsX-like permease family protein [Aestuariibius sp. 2305UL40-4]|uniref:FtsX-like permease family protein n=1 Tax=Aestuariibius violaceus TaxID=3234132 RepID=UPI00345E48FB
MMGAGLQALLSYWRRNPLQALTLFAGLALATALWSGVQAINAEARASYDAAARTLGEGSYGQIARRDGEAIPLEAYVALRRAGWLVSPVIDGRVFVEDRPLRIVGIDPLTAPPGIGPVGLQEGDLAPFVTGEGQVFATPETIESFGEAFDIDFVPAPDIAPDTAVTDISVAGRLLEAGDTVTRLIVLPEQPLGRAELSEIAPDLVLSQPGETADVAQLTDSFHLNLTAFGLLSFAVGIFIVNGAIGLAFEQRRQVFRTLRAVGMPLRRLMVLLGVELFLFATVAGLTGVALGYLIAAALLPDVAATLRGLYGAEVAGTLTLRPVWMLSGLAIAFIGTGMAAAGALYKLWRLPILAAGQRRAWALASVSTARLQAVGAVVLLGAAVAFGLYGEGLVGGFSLLGTLLVGAALGLPVVLSVILAIGARLARSAIGEWFWADTRQQLPGLSLALMALLLAMAANIGVSTMVSSFRLTFIGFIDQRLASEVYVTVDNAAEGDRLEAFGAERADAVLPLLVADAQLAGLPGQVLGARDHGTYRDNWTFLGATDAPWDQIAAGEGALLNEQTARRQEVAVGDPLTIAGEVFPVVGIYSDYGNPVAQAIIGEDVFRTLYPQIAPTRFGLRTEDPDALIAALTDEFGLPPANIIDQAGIKQISLDVFERTFTVTTALNILTLIVAAFAILMSLLTLAGMRLPQLAPVWALGLTRARLGWFELVRALLLAALTAIVALPLGLALAWALLAVVNVEAFGWKLPMYLFPLDYLRLTLLACLAAALAALWPARKLARTPASHLLKVFSNER